MGHPDGAHTHGSSSGLGQVVVILLAVALLGPAIAAAVAELVHLVLIVLAVVAGLAGAGVMALAAFYVHRQCAGGTVQRPLPAPPRQRPMQGAPAPRAVQAPQDPRPALERGGQLHLHFHGVAPEDVAAIIRSQQEDQ